MTYLLLFLTLIAGVLKHENLFKKPVSKISWMLVSILFASTIISFFLEKSRIKSDSKKVAIETNVGVLDPAETSRDKIIWILGGTPFLFDVENINVTEISLPIFGKMMRPFEGVNFIARMNKKKIEVTTTIRDSTGSIILEMIDNEWQVNRPQFAFDRNYNDSTLEVIDNMGNIVFQIQISGNKMILNARFVKPDGQLIMSFPVLEPSDRMPGISGIVNYESGNYKLASQIKFRPYFKYPSALHPNELMEYPLKDTGLKVDNLPYFPKIVKDSSKNYLIIR